MKMLIPKVKIKTLQCMSPDFIEQDLLCFTTNSIISYKGNRTNKLALIKIRGSLK